MLKFLVFSLFTITGYTLCEVRFEPDHKGPTNTNLEVALKLPEIEKKEEIKVDFSDTEEAKLSNEQNEQKALELLSYSFISKILDFFRCIIELSSKVMKIVVEIKFIFPNDNKPEKLKEEKYEDSQVAISSQSDTYPSISNSPSPSVTDIPESKAIEKIEATSVVSKNSESSGGGGSGSGEYNIPHRMRAPSGGLKFEEEQAQQKLTRALNLFFESQNLQGNDDSSLKYIKGFSPENEEDIKAFDPTTAEAIEDFLRDENMQEELDYFKSLKNIFPYIPEDLPESKDTIEFENQTFIKPEEIKEIFPGSGIFEYKPKKEIAGGVGLFDDEEDYGKDETILIKLFQAYRKDDPDKRLNSYQLRCTFSDGAFKITYPKGYIDLANPLNENQTDKYEILFTFIFNCIKKFNLKEFDARMNEMYVNVVYYEASDSDINPLIDKIDEWNQLPLKDRQNLVIEMLGKMKIQKQNLEVDDPVGFIATAASLAKELSDQVREKIYKQSQKESIDTNTNKKENNYLIKLTLLPYGEDLLEKIQLVSLVKT